jgi:hypothetical protein
MHARVRACLCTKRSRSRSLSQLRRRDDDKETVSRTFGSVVVALIIIGEHAQSTAVAKQGLTTNIAILWFKIRQHCHRRELRGRGTRRGHQAGHGRDQSVSTFRSDHPLNPNGQDAIIDVQEPPLAYGSRQQQSANANADANPIHPNPVPTLDHHHLFPSASVNSLAPAITEPLPLYDPYRLPTFTQSERQTRARGYEWGPYEFGMRG